MSQHSLHTLICSLLLAGLTADVSRSDDLTPIVGDDAWQVTAGQYTVRADAKLGAPVLVAEKQVTLERAEPLPAGVELRALLRVNPGQSAHTSAYLYVARRMEKDPADSAKIIEKYLGMTLTGFKANNTVRALCTRDGKPLHDLKALAEQLDWTPQNQNDFHFTLRAYERYPPGWDEEFRARIEHDMAELPGIEDKWLHTRIELFAGFVRFWLDDRLVAHGAAEDTSGGVRVMLAPGVELAGLRIEPAKPTPGFEPIHLAGYANGRALLGSASVREPSLPKPGQVTMIAGVPFVFPGVNLEGKDHLDISRSLLRQANTPGYVATMYGQLPRWRGSAERDPARIQLRVPFGHYRTLHLIAGCDDRADHVPIVSAMFYRPGAGFTHTFAARVPLATATARNTQRLPVTLTNGKKVSLWHVEIPLDPAALTSFADLDVIEVELTKEVHQYRNYPDPITYGYHQGGPASAVHVYAVTLGREPVTLAWEPDRFGHVWTWPEVPAYTATVANHTDTTHTGMLTVATRSYDGTETSGIERSVTVGPRQTVTIRVELPVKLHGLHEVSATLRIGDRSWTEQRSLVRLAPDTRSERWTEGRGAMFGYWAYHGGHHTPGSAQTTTLMTLAGARQAAHPPKPYTDLMFKHWGKGQSTAYYVAPQPWAAEETHDPAKIEKFHQDIAAAFERWEKDLPDQFKPDVVSYFAEAHISPRLTAGTWPEYWQDPPFVYTHEENTRLRMFMETSRIAGEYLRKHHPDRALMIEWGDPGFVIPLLRAGFPKDLIDGSSLDAPLFERLPEMQLADNALHRLYMLKEEYKKYGKEPRLQFCEGSFVPTEPGAVSYRQQMDLYTRWNLISLAYGVTRFYSGWFAFDCGNYYGAEHYGGCGIQRRIPYCDPKPAYAAFAAMTDRLNEANFDGWEHTGSLTTFCLRFKKPEGELVYTLWTIRGRRAVMLTLANADGINLTDSMNNTRRLDAPGGQVTILTDPSVVYVTGAKVTAVSVGEPDHSDALPADTAQLVADLGDGSWDYTSRRDTLYENNHWGFYPALGRFTATVVSDDVKGQALSSKLEDQGRPRELMPWYNTLRPKNPVPLPGAPSHIGLWVKGDSDWGRVIYVLRDAHGEKWISIGVKDDYNCNDVHSWSAFNFDGWRYLRFELPGHLGWDNYRRHGTTWWRSGVELNFQTSGVPSERTAGAADETGDHIVDLPLALEEIIVEQRTHVIYVNDKQPAASDTVRFGKMYVEYAHRADMGAEAVRVSRLRMPAPRGVPDLPNPIARMMRDGAGDPPDKISLRPPEHQYDGTRMHVRFKEVEGAKMYHLWVSAHEDGRGALDLVPTGVKPDMLVTGLRPGIRLYYWLTYVDGEGKMSKPSPVHEEVTVDQFKEK